MKAKSNKTGAKELAEKIVLHRPAILRAFTCSFYEEPPARMKTHRMIVSDANGAGPLLDLYYGVAAQIALLDAAEFKTHHQDRPVVICSREFVDKWSDIAPQAIVIPTPMRTNDYPRVQTETKWLEPFITAKNERGTTAFPNPEYEKGCYEMAIFVDPTRAFHDFLFPKLTPLGTGYAFSVSESFTVETDAVDSVAFKRR